MCERNTGAIILANASLPSILGLGAASLIYSCGPNVIVGAIMTIKTLCESDEEEIPSGNREVEKKEANDAVTTKTTHKETEEVLKEGNLKEGERRKEEERHKEAQNVKKHEAKKDRKDRAIAWAISTIPVIGPYCGLKHYYSKP